MIQTRAGAVVAECQGRPTYVLIAAPGMPSHAPWVNSLEYVVRMVWMPHQMDERPEEFPSGSIDWQALFHKGDQPLALYDIKPRRRSSNARWMKRLHPSEFMVASSPWLRKEQFEAVRAA